MKTLNEKLLALTIANTVKKGTTKSINHLIVEVLESGSKLQRTEIVSRIAEIRYNESAETKLTEEQLDNAEVLEKLLKIIKTVKNGVDTSLSKSNNNSSFHYNQEFANWMLREEDGRYFIRKAITK